MAEIDFKGLGVALATPFKRDLSIDYKALDSLISNTIEGGCDYLVVLGTTAETPTLSYEEKLGITKYIKTSAGGRVPLILGIGGNNTSAVIEDIMSRDLDGYSAILSVTPFYNKPSQEGLFRHFKSICEASPLPLILYNVPSRTGVNLTAQTTIRLAEFSPKILGIKEASGNLQQAKEIIENAPEGFRVISGNDSDTFRFMQAGAAGVISVLANAFPAQVKHLVNLCVQNKFSEAENYQNKLSSIILPLFEEGNPAGVKAVLSQMGLMENILRLPLVPVSKNVDEKLKKASAELLS